MRTTCDGLLAYEQICGIRLHRGGVYLFRCLKCGHSGGNDGRATTCGN